GLRPERVGLNASTEGGRNCFEATVVRRSFLGGRSVYEVRSNSTAFTAEAGATYQEGDHVGVELPAEALRVFALDKPPALGRSSWARGAVRTEPRRRHRDGRRARRPCNGRRGRPRQCTIGWHAGPTADHGVNRRGLGPPCRCTVAWSQG